MSMLATHLSQTQARTSAAVAGKGPFGAFKWQAFVTFFAQRIGLNQTVNGILYPFPLSIFFTPLIIAWLLARGWAKPSPIRIGLFCALVVGACISLLMATHGNSALSMYMYFALYVLFLFPVVLDDAGYERFFRMVAKIGAIICVIGVVQYAIQYVYSPPWLFSWRTLIPEQYLDEFNTMNWTGNWGSGLYKANGFFLMEASWLSQLGARTMLIAIIILKDPRYVLFCAPAMLASYSGTGMVLFGLFGVIPLIMLLTNRRGFLLWAILGAVGATIMLATFAKALNLELFVNRLGEFGRPDTSAYIRFVVVQQAFDSFLREPIPTLIFGAGPSAVDHYLQGLRSDGFAPGWLKLSVEYGFFGFVMFCTFLFTCVWQTTRSYIIAAAMLFQYMVLDGSLVVTQGAIVTLFSLCFVVRRSTFRPFGMAAAPAPSKLAPA